MRRHSTVCVYGSSSRKAFTTKPIFRRGRTLTFLIKISVKPIRRGAKGLLKIKLFKALSFLQSSQKVLNWSIDFFAESTAGIKNSRKGEKRFSNLKARCRFPETVTIDTTPAGSALTSIAVRDNLVYFRYMRNFSMVTLMKSFNYVQRGAKSLHSSKPLMHSIESLENL